MSVLQTNPGTPTARAVARLDSPPPPALISSDIARARGDDELLAILGKSIPLRDLLNAARLAAADYSAGTDDQLLARGGYPLSEGFDDQSPLKPATDPQEKDIGAYCDSCTAYRPSDHDCYPSFWVRREDGGRETEIRAPTARRAAEKWAAAVDWNHADFCIAHGEDAQVVVKDGAGVETRWTVSGESVRTYRAVPR